MRLTEYVHLCLEKRLSKGDCVLDATAGKGYDTLKSAQLIQPNGQVIALDIQEEAIKATEEKLTQAGLNTLCEFHLGNHGEVLKEITQTFDCILFNLGYLPGSDKTTITTPKNTLSALNQCQNLLKANGILFVTAYRQHQGGLEEASVVENWMHRKTAKKWFIQTVNPAKAETDLYPILWIASKSFLNLPIYSSDKHE
mgnify:CR=1 FL=1|jgi:ubiquinone/menaquinone biosynthesis C-methylase UbiE